MVFGTSWFVQARSAELVPWKILSTGFTTTDDIRSSKQKSVASKGHDLANQPCEPMPWTLRLDEWPRDETRREAGFPFQAGWSAVDSTGKVDLNPIDGHLCFDPKLLQKPIGKGSQGLALPDVAGKHQIVPDVTDGD